MVLSAHDRGGAESHNGGVPRAAEEREEKIYMSEGRGKYIKDPVAAGLAGVHGHGWVNGYYTATCVKKIIIYIWATSLCLAVKYVGAQTFCVVLLRRHPDGVDIVA